MCLGSVDMSMELGQLRLKTCMAYILHARHIYIFTFYAQTQLTSGTCGSKLTNISGDPSVTSWLRQRISLSVVRGSTASIVYNAPGPQI